MLNNIYGPPVEGEDFFGREKELEFAIKEIVAGNSIKLAAPRRVGKSSFAKKILEVLKSKGWNTVEIDLEEVKSEEGFVRLFVEALQKEDWWGSFLEKGGDKLSKLIAKINLGIEYEGVKANLEWKHKKKDVYDSLSKLLDHEADTIIMVDELTVLLFSMLKEENGRESVEAFLNWLRSFRQKSKSRIRWIFCSSIGIENFANQNQLSYAINDVPSFPLSAFKEKDAIVFIGKLSESLDLKLDKEHVQYIIEKLDWLLPYFIQVLINKIHYLKDVEDEVISIQLIDKAYSLILGEDKFNTWDERLNYYGDIELITRKLLNHLAKIKEGATRNNLEAILNETLPDEGERNKKLSHILTLLINDGYIMKDDTSDRYVFRSPFIRDFWNFRFNK